MPLIRITPADPQGPEALALLREAAIEARRLYPELSTPDSPWPTNPPLPPRGACVLAWHNDTPVGCAALRPLDDLSAELRRMVVLRSARRGGVARALIAHLEQAATELGYTRLALETGHRQAAAMALYESCGFVRVPPFGEHAGDPASVCYAKVLAGGHAPCSSSASLPP